MTIYLISRQAVSPEVLRPGRSVSAAQSLWVPVSEEARDPSPKAPICLTLTRYSSGFYAHGQGRVAAISCFSHSGSNSRRWRCR